MKIDETKIEIILHYYNKLEVPFYQRKYEWEEDQVVKLLEDIKDNKNNEYYLGSLIFKEKGHNTKVVIDGQQRLTTIWLIMRCIYDICNLKLKSNSSSSLDGLIEIKEKIDAEFKFFAFYASNYKNGKQLSKIIKEGADSAEQNNNHYLTNYHIIMGWLKTNVVDIEEFYYSLNKIIFALISIDEKNDEYVLFSQINSTGKKLTDFDLVRNSLFSNVYNLIAIDQDDAEEFEDKLDVFNVIFDENNTTNDEKDELLKYYLTYKYERFVTDKNYEIYKEFTKLANREEFKLNQMSLYKDLCTFGLIYNFIKQSYTKYNFKFNRCLELLRSNFGTYVTLIASVFLTVLDSENLDYVHNKVMISKEDEEIIYKALKLIEIYLIRRTFCNYSGKNYNRSFPDLVKKIRLNFQGNKEDYPNLLYTILYKKPNEPGNLIDDKTDTYRMPNDNEFEHNFLNRDIYNGNNKFCKNFFIRLSREKNEDKINFKNYTVEHVMPQNLEKWIEDGFVDYNPDEVERLKHTIGNLTITPYNSKYSNSTFKEKQYQMGESESFVINNYFIKNPDLSVWNTDEISKRSKILLAVVNNIWSLDNYKETPLKNTQDDDDDYKYQVVSKLIYPQLGGKKITYDVLCMALNSYLVKDKSPLYIDTNIFDIQESNGLVFKTIIDFLGVKTQKGKMNGDKFDSFIGSRHSKIIKLLKHLETYNSDNY